jgi:hypothetical protein
VVGHTEGHSISQIAVGLKGPNGKVVPMPGMQDLDFKRQQPGIQLERLGFAAFPRMTNANLEGVIQ